MGNVLALAVLVALIGGSFVAWIWIEFSTNENCISTVAINRLRYSEIDFRKVEVNWDPPDGDRNDVFIKYLITLSSPHTSIRTFEVSATNLVLEDLEPCVTYDLSVEVMTNKKYKTVSMQVRISDVDPPEPENIEYNWSSSKIEWMARYQHCIQAFQLKVYHSGVLIRDVITNETVRKYELTDISTCSNYFMSIQTIGKKSTKSIVIEKKIPSLFSPSKTTSIVKNIRYKVLNSNTVALYWDPPEVDDRCIREFLVSVPDAGIYIPVSANSTKAIISPLKPCMEYLVTLMSLNIHKEILGKISDISLRTSTLENKVENLTFSEMGSTLNIKWAAPIVTSSCSEFYTIDICPLDFDVECQSFKPTPQTGNVGMSVSVADLVACAIYKISLSVMKSNKLYEFRSEIYESKVRALKGPILKKIVDLKSTSVSLEWGFQDLKENRNRCPVYSVILECTTDGNSFMSYEFSTIKTSQIFLTHVENLSPYTNYSCYLTFNQHTFKSDKSAVVNFATLEDVPSPVQNITVTKSKPNGFLLKWQPPKSTNGILKTYQVHVKHSRTLYSIPSWCHKETKMSLKSTITAKDHFYNATGLEPYEEYIVSISAATNEGFGAAQEIFAITMPSISRAVTKAQYSIISPHTYMISWKQPCRCNGILKLFKVTVKGNRDNHSDDTFSYSVLPNSSFPDMEYSLKLPKLRPVYNYKIQISAKIEGVEEFGEISNLNFLTPPSVPPLPHYDHLLSQVEFKSINKRNGTQFKISLKKDLFEDTGGDILYYALIVGRDISLNRKTESDFWNVLKDWPIISNYEEASNYDFLFPYQVTPPYWNPFKGVNHDDSIDYVIGDDVVCETPVDGYCNGPLKPNTQYCLKIRAFTAAGYQDSPPIKFTTGSELGELAYANYYLSIICIVLFLMFVICGLYYVRTRHIPLICLHVCSQSPLCEA